MEPLIEQIAVFAADYAVDNWGKHLAPREKAEMWRRFHDNAYAALISFDEVSNARRIRASISEN